MSTKDQLTLLTLLKPKNFMTKLKLNPRNLKLFSSLFWITGLLICGSYTPLQASTVSSSLKVNQTKSITGTVVSGSDNLGIPGVNVIVKGTNIGATTDFDGNYSIKVPESGTLVFSYLGFVTQEIEIGNNITINVTLESDTATLDEVIVIGYGSAKKETLTGSVEQVKSEVFEDLAVGILL